MTRPIGSSFRYTLHIIITMGENKNKSISAEKYNGWCPDKADIIWKHTWSMAALLSQIRITYTLCSECYKLCKGNISSFLYM